MSSEKEPWFKNAFVFCFFGIILAMIVLVADVYLLLRGVEDGLPEAITTPLLALASGITSYAGACITMRSKKAPQGGGETDES